MYDLNDAQKVIAETTEGMLVVDAGPGTGKTKTTVDRYVRILSSGKVSPKDVLMVTFTKNAAGEMEDRTKLVIREAIEKLSSKDVPREERAKIERQTDALENITKELRCSTFDSFCYSVIREAPETLTEFFSVDESLTRAATLVENDTLNLEYFSDIMDRFLRDHGDDYGNETIIASQNYSDMYKLISKLMSRGIVPVKDGGWFGSDREDIPMSRGKEILLGDQGGLEARLNAINDSGRLSKTVLGFKVSDGYGKISLTDGGRDLRDVIKEGEPLGSEFIESTVYGDRKNLIRLVHDVYYEFIRCSIADDRLTFGLTSVFAFIVLYSNAAVREKERCKYLMIDEFQDTNSSQLMIALMLLKEPNLCVVGDWKQGIYGFRYVSIENIIRFEERAKAFRNLLNEGEPRVIVEVSAVKNSLTENYRSSQAIIDASFKALEMKATKEEEKERILARLEGNVTRLNATRADIGGNTEIVRVDTGSKDTEPIEVLRRIQNYCNNGKYLIADRKTKQLRKIKYSDIAILCRTTNFARSINDLSRKYNVPVFLQGDVDVMGSREGKLLLAWLRLVNNGKDRQGIATILSDLEYPFENVKRAVDGTDPLPPEISGFRAVLKKKKRRITDLITTVFAYYGLSNDITQAIISIVSSSFRGTLLTVSDIIRVIEKDIDEGTTYPIDAFLDESATLTMTMHKSKGLEFPVVIAVGFDSKSFPNTSGDKDNYVLDDMLGLRSKKTVDTFEDGSSFIVKSWKTYLANETRKRDYDEERRLLFVALSRAEQYITIIAGKPSQFFEDAESFAKEEKPLKFEPFSDANEEGAHLIDAPEIPRFNPRRQYLAVHDLMSFEGGNVADGADQQCAKGMEYGTKVHKIAEMLVHGIYNHKTFKDFPETARIKKVLKGVENAPVILAEVPCLLPVDECGATIRGVIDLYVEYGDRVEIHDYKTDVTRTFEQEYRFQLSVYAQIAARDTRKPVKCFIQYLSQEATVEFDPEPMETIVARTRECMVRLQACKRGENKL